MLSYEDETFIKMLQVLRLGKTEICFVTLILTLTFDRANRQTDRQTDADDRNTPATSEDDDAPATVGSFFDEPISKLVVKSFREMFLLVSRQRSHKTLKPDLTGSTDNVHQLSSRVCLILSVSFIIQLHDTCSAAGLHSLENKPETRNTEVVVSLTGILSVS